MSWPLSHEFNESIQNPRVAFADPELKAAEALVGATGLPLPRSGNFADVYQVRGADGRDWAVKCFTRAVAGLAERYAQVSAAVTQAKLPFTIGFTYLAEGIRVGGAWRPVVKMEWVEGLLLNQVARENAAKPAVLTALGQMWVKLCKRLREAGIAHADVQHGNVLLVPGTRPGAYGLKLIDYDGMWVPALANTPSGESGHPSYQHPARAATRAYSPDVDRFPHLVVATALKGLAVGGAALWEKYDTGDNLLFTESDYQKPPGSKLLKELWHAGDPALQALAGRLAIACGKPIPQTPWLDQLAPEGDAAPLDDATRREAAAALGISLPVPIPLPPEPSSAKVAPRPAPVPAPVRASVDEDEDEVDAERAEAPTPNKRKKRKKEQKANGGGRLLLIGGGLLVLLGGLVAAVALVAAKKPQEAVQEKPEPKEPETRAVPETPKPTGKTPDSSPPTDPPSRSGGPPTVSAAEQLVPRQRWATPLPDAPALGVPVCSRDGQTVAVPSDPLGEVLFFDLVTGKRLEGPPDQFDHTGRVVPLDGGRFAGGAIRGPTLSVWDPRAGKVARTFPTDGLVSPGLAYVSPTGKYIASTSENAEGKDVLKLRGTQPDKLILDTTWLRGTIHFTDDETQVLVADAAGGCRWFKLPSGETGKGWTIIRKGPDKRPGYGITAVSGDGSVVLFWGRLADQLLGLYAFDGAGQLQKYFARGASLLQEPSASRDGRLVLSNHPGSSGQPDRVVINDSTTGKVTDDFAIAGFPTCRPVLLPDGRGCVAVLTSGARRTLVRFDLAPSGEIVTRPPDPQPAPNEPAALKPLWSAATTTFCERPYFTTDGKSVLAGSPARGGGGAFDRATGAPQKQFADLVKDHATAFFQLTQGRVGTWAPGDPVISMWAEATGENAGKLDVPALPQPAGGDAYPLVRLSKNARFVAAGWSRDGQVKFESPLPIRVFDYTTNKAIVSLDWAGGYVHFTTDAARVLLAEFGGRCRWYKLPGGEPDGSWEFAGPKGSRHAVTDISAGGSVLAYFGPLGRTNGTGSATLNGKTGAVLHLFRPGSGGSEFHPVVSADGQRVAAPWGDDGGAITFDVADARTGALHRRIGLGRRAAAALSSDGTALALAVNTPTPSVQLFDVPGAEPLAPGGVAQLRTRWTIDDNKAAAEGQVYLDRDGQTVGLVHRGVPWSIAAFDPWTGAAVRNLPDRKSNFFRLFPLDKGACAYQTTAGWEVTVWNPRAGKTTVKPFPPPAGLGGHTAYTNVSPNGRYLAVSLNSSGRGGEKEVPETPLQVIDTTTGQSVVTADWCVGGISFTADSSRMLLVDDSGRFRWFKLPSGQPDGEWTFGQKSRGYNVRDTPVSADGGVILYYGRPPNKEESHHLLDGKTGAVLYSFPAKLYLSYSFSVSDDGRHVMLLRTDGFGMGHTIEVLNVRGRLVAAAGIPKGPGNANPRASVAISWKSGTVAVHDRNNHKLTVLDLPDLPGGDAPTKR